METTIDKAISHLYTYSSTMGSGQTTQEQHEESKKIAIDTMRKYQKIEQILKKRNGEHIYKLIDEIIKVAEGEKGEKK